MIMNTLSALLGRPQCHSAARRGAFTLVEILVAVAIMALLLAIILVPLRLGFETTHIGIARSSLQGESQLTLQQMGKDFSRASFVFPNGRIPGISDGRIPGISNNSDSTSACSLRPYMPYMPNGTVGDVKWKYLPYFESTATPGAVTDPADPASGIGVTKSASTAFANPNRIDMLFLRRVSPVSPAIPASTPVPGFSAQTGEDYVVTYYPRRKDISKPYDEIDNPILLFRAQYPYRYYKTSAPAVFDKFPLENPPTTKLNAEVDWSQYPPLGASSNAITDRNFLWISHNYYGEANLEPLTQDITLTSPEATLVPRSHTLAIPRDMQLVAPKAGTGDANSLMPELSFVESSSNGNRIDRVTVSMTLAQYDQIGAASVNGKGKAQRVPVTQTFDLPNAGCSN